MTSHIEDNYTKFADPPQRAFRQRKEGYIKKLEEQVKDYQNMETNYRALQNENYQLREYILNLQSRLLESDSSFPPAPSHINLQQGSAIRAAADDATAQLQREMEREREKYAPPTSTAAGAMAQGAMSQLQSAASQATEV